MGIVDTLKNCMKPGAILPIDTEMELRLKELALKNQYAMAQQQAAMNQGMNMAAQSWAMQHVPDGYRPTIAVTPKQIIPTFEELDDPDSAFNLSLEALSNMWGARFGYRWVKDEDTADALEENNLMWQTAASRLIDAGLLVQQQVRHPDKLGYDTAWKLIEKDHGNR